MNYWDEKACDLRASLAGKGPEFVGAAPLEEIEAAVGAVFSGLSLNTKLAIIAVMRSKANAYVAYPAGEAATMGAFNEDAMDEADAIASMNDDAWTPAEAMSGAFNARAA